METLETKETTRAIPSWILGSISRGKGISNYSTPPFTIFLLCRSHARIQCTGCDAVTPRRQPGESRRRGSGETWGDAGVTNASSSTSAGRFSAFLFCFYRRPPRSRGTALFRRILFTWKFQGRRPANLRPALTRRDADQDTLLPLSLLFAWTTTRSTFFPLSTFFYPLRSPLFSRAPTSIFNGPVTR